MRKKLDIAEKLKKLSEGKKEKPPIFKPRKVGEIEEGVKKKGVEESKERLYKVKGRKEEPPTRVTKPPIQPKPLSIKDLAIPASAYELFSIEIALDPTGKEKVMQLLSLRENPEVKLKWTVFRDPYMKEFDWLKREGLVQIRDDPLIYGREFDEGTLVASHIGDYTFSMGSYDLKTERLVELFIFGLNNARKYDLKV